MAETREALISAGLDEFGRNGLDAPSLDGICAKAGFTRGAFYVHFRDRDDFITAVMDRALRAFFDSIFARDEADLLATVARFQKALDAGGRALPFNAAVPLYRIIESCRRSQLIRERFTWHIADAQSRLAAAGRAGQREGRLRDDVNPDRLAEMLMAAAFGEMAIAEAGVPINAAQGGEIIADLLRVPGARRGARG